MAAIPTWLLGRHLTAISVTGNTVAADGTLTPGTTKSLSGFIDAVTFNSDPALDMIMSVDHTQANYEIMYDDFSITLVEILARTNVAGRVPVLPVIASTFDVLTVTFTRGGQSYGMTAARGAFRDGVEGFGKNSCSLTLRPRTLADGSSTVTYA